MEETISVRLVAMGLFSLVLTAALTMTMFHRAFDRQVEQDLEFTARTLAASAAYLPHPAQLEEFTQEGQLRITLIGPDGEVLFESEASGPLENHLDRPEVQQALQGGVGHSRRTSGTMGYNTYYCAVRMASGGVLRLAQDAASLYAVFDSALPAVVVVCVLVLFAAVVLAFLLTRRLVKPIGRMARHLDEIDAYVPYKELEPFAEAIQQDQALRQQNALMRQEFTANVSHELKTPLTSISGYAELIEQGVAKPQDVPVFAGKIRAEAGRLLALIRDILKLNELDQPPTPPAFEPVELQKLARGCAQRLALNAQNAYVTLRTEGPELTVQGSPGLLEELCYNLCDNAIRYNRPGGTVVVRTGRGPEGPYLEVQDNGIGIAPEHQQRVFERFYRVDKSRSRATGGTGLGLAIVKHCAMLHSAQLMLHSTPGQGTTIRVTFPA